MHIIRSVIIRSNYNAFVLVVMISTFNLNQQHAKYLRITYNNQSNAQIFIYVINYQ